MHIWNTIKGVGVVLSMTSLCFDVTGMEFNKEGHSPRPYSELRKLLPPITIDGTTEHPEGKRLSYHHETAERRGFMTHIPRNIDELNHLYEYCKELKKNRREQERMWKDMLLEMEQEITARCFDGDLFFIDKYLEHLETFINMTLSYRDPDFTSFLYRRDDERWDVETILWDVVVSMYNMTKPSKFHPQYDMDAMHLLHFVVHVDAILSKANQNTRGFFELFDRLYLDPTFRDSPAYKLALEASRKILNDGIDLKI